MNLVFLPEEDEVVDTEHVERCHSCHHAHPEAPANAFLVASHENLILTEEACKRRNTCNSQATNKECNASDGHVLVQAVHLAVLIAVNSVDDCTGTQEEQCLEHSVSEQVEHRSHVAKTSLVTTNELTTGRADGK